MPREAEPSLSERTFILKALDEGLRIDNRKFDEGRPVVLSLGDDYGVADVKFGQTRHVMFFLEATMASSQSANKILCTESLQKCQPR
jgi:exosome complex component RRP45